VLSINRGEQSIANKKQHKTVGLALGGGGMKGTAHIGVLKVLAEYGVRIDMVAGTSIGAAVAALYASGYDWKMMKNLYDFYDIPSLIRLRPTRRGLITANEYTDFIRLCTKGKRLEEMDIPIKLTAVDLVSGRLILFSRGDTAIAVRASSSIPGVFTPVEMGDMMLVDGGLFKNCPGDVVRDMGADVVISVDLYVTRESAQKNIFEVVARSLDIAARSYQQIDGDIILQPISSYVFTLNPDIMQACFEMGEQCAREHIDEILEAVYS
jgi:NTE family protein